MLGILLAAALTIATPEEAVALLSADAPVPKEAFESAKAIIESAAAQEPNNNRSR